jgi:hypothetical protein
LKYLCQDCVKIGAATIPVSLSLYFNGNNHSVMVFSRSEELDRLKLNIFGFGWELENVYLTLIKAIKSCDNLFRRLQRSPSELKLILKSLNPFIRSLKHEDEKNEKVTYLKTYDLNSKSLTSFDDNIRTDSKKIRHYGEHIYYLKSNRICSADFPSLQNEFCSFDFGTGIIQDFTVEASKGLISVLISSDKAHLHDILPFTKRKYNWLIIAIKLPTLEIGKLLAFILYFIV